MVKEVKSARDVGVGEELRYALALEPLHPDLHAAVVCQVVSQRQHQPDVVLACARNHIIQPLQQKSICAQLLKASKEDDSLTMI